MQKIDQYSNVRIKDFRDLSIDRDGWNFNKRAPEIGEIGTVVDILEAQGLPDKYAVELSDSSDGTTIWLSEFVIEELESV